MLELTENQLQQMRQHEHAGFVSRLRAEIVRDFPELSNDADLEHRLGIAHDRAIALGLDSGTSRTQFLYHEAFTPSFSRQPAVTAWIKRPGASAEQRWRDFMALASAKLGADNPAQE